MTPDEFVERRELIDAPDKVSDGVETDDVALIVLAVTVPPSNIPSPFTVSDGAVNVEVATRFAAVTVKPEKFASPKIDSEFPVIFCENKVVVLILVPEIIPPFIVGLLIVVLYKESIFCDEPICWYTLVIDPPDPVERLFSFWLKYEVSLFERMLSESVTLASVRPLGDTRSITLSITLTSCTGVFTTTVLVGACCGGTTTFGVDVVDTTATVFCSTTGFGVVTFGGCVNVTTTGFVPKSDASGE
jgi:hypothetical protein